jgi:hypothetical protein
MNEPILIECEGSAEGELIEKMADAISVCSEMLNGRDQMLDALAGGEGPSTKSPLTVRVDDALEAWREYAFAARVDAGKAEDAEKKS